MKNFIFALTFSRILAGPLIFLLILWAEAFAVALIIFLIVAITDFWDGYLARKYNLTSTLGAIMDPIADKILIIFILMALALYLNSSFIAFIGCCIFMREIWVSALRDFNAQEGNAGATAVTLIAKYKTASQLISCAIYLYAISVNSAFLLFLSDFVLFFALLITLYSGLIYSINSFSKPSK